MCIRVTHFSISLKSGLIQICFMTDKSFEGRKSTSELLNKVRDLMRARHHQAGACNPLVEILGVLGVGLTCVSDMPDICLGPQLDQDQ